MQKLIEDQKRLMSRQSIARSKECAEATRLISFGNGALCQWFQQDLLHTGVFSTCTNFCDFVPLGLKKVVVQF
jgi:hypothetical protein